MVGQHVIYMLEILQPTLCLEKGQIDAIYSDFEKAFDKVPHK